MPFTRVKHSEQIAVNLVLFLSFLSGFCRLTTQHFSCCVCGGAAPHKHNQGQAPHKPELGREMKSTPLCSSPDCWFPTQRAVLMGSLGSNKSAHLSVEKRGLLLSYNVQSVVVLFFFFASFLKLHRSKANALVWTLVFFNSFFFLPHFF